MTDLHTLAIKQAQEHQRDFCSKVFDRGIAYGGFGSGKTWAGVERALRVAIGWPGSQGFVGGISWAKHIKPLLIPMFQEQLPEYYIMDTNMSDFYAEIRGPGIDPGKPSKVYFFGMGNAGDHKGYITRSFDWAFVDEAVDVNEQNFCYVVSRLRGQIGPGWFFASTHTDAPDCWLKEYIDEHNWSQFKMETTANSMVPQAYIKSMLETFHGAQAERYIFGDWVSFAGRFFDYNKKKIWEQDNLPHFTKKVLFVDPASAEKGDYWVAIILGKTDQGDIFVLDLERHRGIDVLDQINILSNLCNKWSPSEKYVESNGYAVQLQKTGLRWIPDLKAEPALKSKEERALAVSGAWSNEKVFWALDDLILQRDAIREVCAFPGAKHDDIVDALSGGYNILMKNLGSYRGGVIIR